MSDFFTKLFSGADNQSPAIGRVLGALLFINMLTLLPAVVAGVLVLQRAPWAIWQGVFMCLTAFIPAVVGSITLLINVTNSTEPKA